MSHALGISPHLTWTRAGLFVAMASASFVSSSAGDVARYAPTPKASAKDETPRALRHWND